MIVLQVSQFTITHTDSRNLQQTFIWVKTHSHTSQSPTKSNPFPSRLQNIPINNTIPNPTPPQNLQVPLPSICIFTTIIPTSANMQHPRNRSSRSRSQSQPIPPFRPQIVLKHPKSTKVGTPDLRFFQFFLIIPCSGTENIRYLLLSLDYIGCVTARDSIQSRSFLWFQTGKTSHLPSFPTTPLWFPSLKAECVTRDWIETYDQFITLRNQSPA